MLSTEDAKIKVDMPSMGERMVDVEGEMANQIFLITWQRGSLYSSRV